MYVAAINLIGVHIYAWCSNSVVMQAGEAGDASDHYKPMGYLGIRGALYFQFHQPNGEGILFQAEKYAVKPFCVV